MARLIDADALKAQFDEEYDDAFMQMHTRANIGHWESYSIGINWGRNTIADAPTVDAVPVVHGRWIEDYDTFIQDNGYESEPIHTGFVCSVCGRHSFAIEPFCHCGAKMDLEVKDA